MESVWPDLLIDDVTSRTADDLDVELLREFFGSSLGEDIAKFARKDDTSPKPSTSTPSLPSLASTSSPPEPSPSESTPTMASPPPSMSSTSVPSTSSPPLPATPTSSTAAPPSRKRKLTQERSCVNCQTHESSMWRRDPDGNSMCNACGQHFYKFKVHRPAAMFNRPIKKRCRKVKQDGTKAASSALLPPMPHFNFEMALPYRFQQQPQQMNHLNPPPYAYYQPAPPIPFYQPPPPEVYHPYGYQSYPMMPSFQEGHW